MFSAVGCWYGTCVEVEVLVVLVVGLNPRILDFVRNTAMIIRNVPDFAVPYIIQIQNPKEISGFQ